MKLYFCWLELQSKSLVIHVVVFKPNGGLDRVLFQLVIHFGKDHVSRLLVDAYLGFDDHVVDESNESSEVVVVELRQLKHSVAEFVLNLH